jgi:hypothetical protein
MVGVFPVIMMQLFIAVINENFDVEEAKKHALSDSSGNRPQESHGTWILPLNPYRWIRARRVVVVVEELPTNLVLPMQKSVVQDYSVPGAGAHSIVEEPTMQPCECAGRYSSKSLTVMQKLFAGKTKNDIPLRTLRNARSGTLGEDRPPDEEMERDLCADFLMVPSYCLLT